MVPGEKWRRGIPDARVSECNGSGGRFRNVSVSGCNRLNPKGENVRETKGKQRSKGVKIGTE